jgi:hypothetical protein
MTIEKLDFLFPFIIFVYGAIMTIVLHHPVLVTLAETRFPAPLFQQMRGHRFLALICLFLGAIWSLQNLWFK